jgi:hypothetical protein
MVRPPPIGQEVEACTAAGMGENKRHRHSSTLYRLCLAAIFSLFLQGPGARGAEHKHREGSCSAEECVEKLLEGSFSGADGAHSQEALNERDDARTRRGGVWETEENLEELRDRAVKMFYHSYDRCEPKRLGRRSHLHVPL